MVSNPATDGFENQTAELTGHERHYQQRSHLGEYQSERAFVAAGKVQYHRSHQSRCKVADEAVCSHRFDIGSQHAADDYGRHGYRSQHAYHRTLSNHCIERREDEKYAYTHHELKGQKPEMEP